MTQTSSKKLQPPIHKASEAWQHRDSGPAIQWPSFQGNANLVGTSPSGRVTVYVDSALPQPGQQNATDLLNDADRVVSANDALFGISQGTVNVIVFALDGHTDGTGGADHMGCDFVNGANIEVCASFGNAARVSGLFEAELSECCMNNNLCGESTGEALSRWCATVISNNALADFVTAPTWFQDGMPDYVNQTDPTDRSADSTGCGMAFLSWLMMQGYGLDKIAQGMVALGDAGTLAQLYAGLSGQPANQAWPTFQSAVQALPNGVTSDDPFGGSAQPAQLAHLAPWTVELAGKVFAEILAAIAAGKEPHQIVAGVRAVMVSAPKAGARQAHAAKLNGRGSAVCNIGSHRLRLPK